MITAGVSVMTHTRQTARENDSTLGTEITTTTTTTVNEKCNRGQQNKEDFCFVCFGGGDLLFCDFEYCPKAYHPRCINREKSYSIVGSWKCEWHTCSNCKKAARYFCRTCTYSLCKGCKECIKEAEYSCVRGKKGFCKVCMGILALIEKNEQGKKEMRPTESAATTTQNIGPGGKKAKKQPRNIVCNYCGKKFRKDYSLQSHTEAKHSTTMACFDLQSHTEAKHSTPVPMDVSGENSSDEDDEDAPKKRPTESATERKAELIITPQNIGPGGKKASKRAMKQALNIVCKYCGKYFWKEHSLQRHIETKHNNGMF